MNDDAFELDLFDPDPFEMFDEGLAAVTGTVVTSQAVQTIAATGVLAFVGSAATSQAPQSMATSGVEMFAGAVVTVQAAQALAASGVLAFVGAAAANQAAQTMSASGTAGAGVAPPVEETYEPLTWGAIIHYVPLREEPPLVIRGTAQLYQASQSMTARGIVRRTVGSARLAGRRPVVKAAGRLRIMGAADLIACTATMEAGGKLRLLGMAKIAAESPHLVGQGVYSTEARDMHNLRELLALMDAA